MTGDNQKRKVYSPDITPYSFEGKGGLFNTISYFIVSPFRLISRVMHNIFVMPANIQDEFAEGLLVVACCVTVLGLIDLIVYHKWVLLVSQLPLFPIAIKIRKNALEAKDIASTSRTVDIDTEQVAHLIETVYDDLNNVVED